MSYNIEKALFFNRRIINGLHNFMTYLPDGESLKKLHPSRFIIDDMPTQMNGGVTFNTHYKCHFEHIYETHFIELNLTRIKLYLEFHGIPQKLLVLKKIFKDDKQIGYRIHIGFENAEKNGKQVQGVRLNVRGNGETYNVFIRTTEMQSYSDYYSASFKTNENWEMIDLPFNKFKRKRSKNSILDAKDIRTFSIVAYGRDFTADVSVSTIEFYY